MPELYLEEQTKETQPQTLEDAEIVRKLEEYLEPRYNPWRADYLFVVQTARRFAEGNHWDDIELQKLIQAGVPPIVVDRTRRAIESLKGMRDRANTKKKIVPREGGDEQVARLLELITDYIGYTNGLDEIEGDNFESGLIDGLGIRKFGWDPNLNAGEGDVFIENVKTEDLPYDPLSWRLDLTDARWICHKFIKPYQDFYQLAPGREAEINALAATNVPEFETGRQSGVTATAYDYNARLTRFSDSIHSFVNTIEGKEFWIKRSVGRKQIASFIPTNGLILPQIRIEPMSYQSPSPQVDELGNVSGNQEQVVKSYYEDEWHQYILAGSTGKSILIKHEVSEFPFPPFVLFRPARKKSGAPYGLVEKVAPLQKLINVSAAQVIAYNNKLVKSPLIAEEGSLDLERAKTSSEYGSILFVKRGYRFPMINTLTPLNIASTEIGQQARVDFDVIAASTEPVMRGVDPQADSSGVKLGILTQNASTSLNPYIRAENFTRRWFWEKIVYIVQKKYTTQRMFRVAGEVFAINVPMMGIEGQVVQRMNDVTVGKYDVMIEDSSISDFERQQEFNAFLAMKQMGAPISWELIGQRAPVKNPEMLLKDMKQQEMLIAQAMMIPQPQTPGNGQKGKKAEGGNAPQAGTRSMMGGTTGMPNQGAQ